ncbi:Cof-type HAD-IIB family hydrolase [Psychrobacter frigidicola]|uniref:Cof-type HAD-IIB family hydrolase n=1 Tax=Psychrobacter frigidicola TaxID=45611 RepID=A0A5C6ZZ48_9GAMM|nr:Cof-type HAD-IIB family hydrolase [Psychrobacter frigidicola]TXD96345.1 Cof-type HAD-IIB family hydrolase [Psychrobacter frigidicola]
MPTSNQTQSLGKTNPITIPIPTPKIIFFDIDDTLSRNGEIAPQNKATLEALAKTDIKLVISTGRSKPILPLDIIALLEADVLDAIICMNGQYSFDNKRVISDYPLSSEQTTTIAELCKNSNLVYKFDSATHIVWSDEHEWQNTYHDKIKSCSMIDPEYCHFNTVYQCSVFFDNQDQKMQDIDFIKHELKLVHWHDIVGDILPIDASKARGILDVCAHFDIDASDCMAFGDGLNDLEMFDLVGYAVAMGDAKPELKEKADFITGTIEEYGIQAVLNPFHLV